MEDSHLRYVLVVDDEEEYQAIIQRFLLGLGYSCESSSNAFEALEKLHKQQFDLVISDIQMAEKDGIQLMREAQAIFPHLEFIIMTGHSEEYSYSDIISAGATDFITKPFEMGKLKSKLERIQRERSTLHQLYEANEQLHKTNASLNRELEVNASISELSKGLIGSLSLDDISSLVLKHAQHLTESQVGHVGYLDQKTGSFVSGSMTSGVWDKCLIADKEVLFKKHAGLWGWVLEHREAILTNNPFDDPRSSGVPQEHIPIHRFLSVPAIANEILLGEVALANSERDYTEDDLAVVRNLAAIYALAVQRKWTEEELREANEHLENIFDNTAEAIGIVDEHGRFVKWNKAAEGLFGYSFEELQGKSFSEVYARKDELDQLVEKLKRDGFIYGYEIDVRRKDAHIVPARISIRSLKDKEGRIMGSVAVATDLSDIKNTLSELRMSNERLTAEMAERERMEEKLREARDELEKLVVDRTERLSKAGSLLKRSIDRLKEITEE